MSHGDRITRLPEGFIPLARSGQQSLCGDGRHAAKIFRRAVSPRSASHAERRKTICSTLSSTFAKQNQAGLPNRSSRMQSSASASRWGMSACWPRSQGGVDSSVAAALVHEAIGDQLVAVFVDTGLLRNERRGAGRVRLSRSSARRADYRGCQRRVFLRTGGRDRAGAKAQDRRREIHPHLRSPGLCNWASPGSWCREQFIRTWSNRLRRTAARPRRSRPITTSAGCRRICSSSWSSRCATCSRTKCAPSARRSGCRSRWSGGSRSRARD